MTKRDQYQAVTPYERFLVDRIRSLELQLKTERDFSRHVLEGTLVEGLFVREYRKRMAPCP